MGMGRGMGGFQTAPSAIPTMPTTPTSREEEMVILGNQMGALQQQLEQIKKRLEELKGSQAR
jgi:hypothetical protein